METYEEFIDIFATALMENGGRDCSGAGLYAECARLLCGTCGNSTSAILEAREQGVPVASLNPLVRTLAGREWLQEHVDTLEKAVLPLAEIHQEKHTREGRERAAAEIEMKIGTLAEKMALELKARKKALRLVQVEESKPLPEPIAVREFMSIEYSQEPWLFEGVIEVGQNVVISGYRKAGKTTTVLHLLKSYCVGSSFLGIFEPGESVGECPVMYLNMEVNEREMQKYIRRMGLEDQEKLFTWNLTGHRFNILDDLHYEQLGNFIVDKNVCSLFIDPLRNVFVGDEDDNSLAKEVTDRFDSLKVDSGCLHNLLIVCHTGHTNGQDAEPGAFARPRGASRWGDWPSVLLSLTTNRQRDRFFSMIGRNGEFTASQLRLIENADGNTLWLDMATGPSDVRSNTIESVLLKALADSHPNPLNSSALKRIAGGDDAVTLAVIGQLQTSGLVLRERVGTAFHHTLTSAGWAVVQNGVAV